MRLKHTRWRLSQTLQVSGPSCSRVESIRVPVDREIADHDKTASYKRQRCRFERLATAHRTHSTQSACCPMSEPQVGATNTHLHSLS